MTLYSYNTSGIELNQTQSDVFQLFVSSHEKKFVSKDHNSDQKDQAENLEGQEGEEDGSNEKGGDLYGHIHSLQTTKNKVFASTFLRADLDERFAGEDVDKKERDKIK